MCILFNFPNLIIYIFNDCPAYKTIFYLSRSYTQLNDRYDPENYSEDFNQNTTSSTYDNLGAK